MNNVVIHQDAIKNLISGPEVTKFVEDVVKQKAEKIVETLKEDISGKTKGYFKSAEFTSAEKDVANDVGYRDEGEGLAVIGIVDGYTGKGRSKAERIVNRADLFPAWLRAAIEAEGFKIS